MTRIGPGTPAGKLLRHYWQPVALVDEMQGNAAGQGGAPPRARTWFFSRTRTNMACIERHCPHRGADLAYGRLEDGGLRCSLPRLAVRRERQVPRDAGRARGQPPVRAHPAARLPGQREERHPVRLPRRRRAAGVPALRLLRRARRVHVRLQGLLGLQLAAGARGRHRSGARLVAAQVLRGRGSGRRATAGSSAARRRTPSIPISKVLREFDRPEIRVERTEYGMRLHTLRKISDAQTHIRVTNILFPQAFVIPMNAEMTISQWHVPVDDYGCYWYSIFTSFGAPVDKDTMRSAAPEDLSGAGLQARFFAEKMAGGSDADEQRRKTFTGMGFDINIHDQLACESQGRIAGPHQGEPRHAPTRASCSTAACCWTRSARTRPARSRRWCSMRGRARDHRAAGGRRHRPQRSHGRILEGLRREAPQQIRLGRA